VVFRVVGRLVEKSERVFIFFQRGTARYLRAGDQLRPRI
jgi:hypothetical protein